MIWKTIIGNELYVFYNGELIYKKWLDTGRSLTFDKVWGGFCWSSADIERTKNNVSTRLSPSTRTG